jgi:hypothetical protein
MSTLVNRRKISGGEHFGDVFVLHPAEPLVVHAVVYVGGYVVDDHVKLI